MRPASLFPILSAVGILISADVHAFTLTGSNSSQLRGWQTDTLTYHLNTANCGAATPLIRSAVEDALALWNSVSNSRLRIELGSDTTTTVAQAQGGTATDYPVILCDPNFNTTTSQTGNNGVIGTGYTATSNGTITAGYLLLNADTTNSPTQNVTLANATTLSIIVAHEIGHTLGLGHSADPDALMYYNASGREHLRLAQDDMDGIAYLYPRKEPGDGGVFGCATVSSDSSPPTSSPGNALAFAFWCLFLPLTALAWQRYRSI